MEVFYKNMSEDFEQSLDDPYIYPVKMPDDVIKKLPPTAVFTGEFDCFRRDSHRFSKRLF